MFFHYQQWAGEVTGVGYARYSRYGMDRDSQRCDCRFRENPAEPKT
jgi:hypothetical protein